jgi:uncharacterized membrane protein
MPASTTTTAPPPRRFFGRGLTVLLPSILTLWILWYAVVFVFDNVAVPINKGIRRVMVEAAPLVVSAEPAAQPDWYRVTPEERAEFVKQREGQAWRELLPEKVDRHIRMLKFEEYWSSHWYFSISGLLVAILLIYLAGMLLGGLLGRKLYNRIEALVSQVPGFKQIYPHVKQLVNLVIGDKPMAFKRVVMVEYPRQGIWSLGLVTSSAMKSINDRAAQGCVTVFIPSTPTPFTGFTITVPAADVIDVPISIDEALRFVLTGGVLVPESQASGPQDPLAAELARRLAGGADHPA